MRSASVLLCMILLTVCLFGCNQYNFWGDTLYSGRDEKIGVWQKFKS